jgi:NAD(P)-dependent dehydrogenase (short-subunit alcohol dehydrogenase family)
MNEIDNIRWYSYNAFTLSRRIVMNDFKGKVAVITGASSGIGFGLAERCAQEGMKVVLAGINEENLKKAEKEIKKTGAQTYIVKTDVSKREDVEALAKKTLDKFGKVNLLFNNAGVGAPSTTWEATLNDWQWVLEVNLWGVIYGVHYFIPVMLKQGEECHVINTSSTAGLAAYPFNSPYITSKYAVLALTEALFHDLKASGITNIGVSVVCPGWIRTKVAMAFRNRPANLANKPGEGVDLSNPVIQEMAKGAMQLLENGMSPQKTADVIFAGIREKKFYLLPNAEEFFPAIRAQGEDAVLGRDPTPLQ